MDRLGASPFASMVFLWPALVAESTSELASAAAKELVNFAVGGAEQPSVREPRWATRNRVVIELLSLRLRDFSTTSDGVPTLLCAPFALHGATITDFAPGHSLVKALQGARIGRLFVTDWRSASPNMRFLSIDNYLWSTIGAAPSASAWRRVGTSACSWARRCWPTSGRRLRAGSSPLMSPLSARSKQDLRSASLPHRMLVACLPVAVLI
jgi:hypothetical protein